MIYSSVASYGGSGDWPLRSFKLYWFKDRERGDYSFIMVSPTDENDAIMSWVQSLVMVPIMDSTTS